MNEIEKDELNHQFADLAERINLLEQCIESLNEKIECLDYRLDRAHEL